MTLGFLHDLQTRLNVGRSYASALKNAAGYRGGKFDIDGCIAWLKKHKDFTVRWCNPQDRKVSPSYSSDAQE